MKELIKEITETNEGFDITTTEQVISLGINMDSCCCETFGYFMTEDDLGSFIDQFLLGVKLVDTALRVQDIPRDLDCGDTMFVNLETSKGTLQFVAYNAHNGYYGHSAWVRSNQLTERVVL